MKSKIWVIGWIILVLFSLGGGIAPLVYIVDPFMHYHAPDTSVYYYNLDNQRSQNDGISKYFTYDALITGTSMTENFKTSEFDEIFGVTSIKVPYSGGTYQEINDNLINALTHNPNLKIIVRGLDMNKFFQDRNVMRSDLGSYPMYLYDNNPFNDVNYLFNKDVIFGRVYQMILASEDENFTPGMTSFDDYSCWQNYYSFGKNGECFEKIEPQIPCETAYLTESEKETIQGNIFQNVTSLAMQYPDVDFYYFITPYSIVWWQELVEEGTIYKQIEAEGYIIELILECENIHLFSFNNRTDIITNLNHYKDSLHYGQWINTMMLKWMHDGDYQLTRDNYKAYLNEELEFYGSFDYESLNNQEDYENDSYAAAILNEELTGLPPINIFEKAFLETSNAEFVEGQYDGMLGLQCNGNLKRKSGSEMDIADYLLYEHYNGAKISLQSIDEYRYLVFYGKRISDYGQPVVCIYNDKNEVVSEWLEDYKELDQEWHQYVLDIASIEGEITIIFNGGCIEANSGDEASYIFSNVMLY